MSVAYSNTSYYRKSFESAGFEPGDLKRLEDITDLPKIDKHTIREHMADMCQKNCRHGVDCISTGGTGGVPMYFCINSNRSAIEYAYLVSSWRRMGYELGMPMAVLRERVVKPDRDNFHHEYDPILRRHWYSSFHMTDANMRSYLHHISTIGPCVLHVYPSIVGRLASFLRRTGSDPPKNIRGIIAESEIVYPQQRRMVEETFGCRYFACYGHSEKCVLAAECEYAGRYHVWPTYGYFELLDAKGLPVTTPGEAGEIVVTGFINTAMPFIRYRTGDYATYLSDHCEACGREHTVICDIYGHRTQEVLIAADGSEIPWAAMNMHDDTFVNVRQFQFRQRVPGRATLQVVSAGGFGEKDKRRILRRLSEKLNGQLHLEFELTDSIRLSPRAKTIYVDQRITLDERRTSDQLR